MLRRSGYAPSSHGGKAIMDVLDTYPRDELFQASIDELAPVVEKVAHLKERRQVRLFVRREPYGRYLSCLVYLPRDRYTTAVRKRMEELLLRRLGGASIDYTARVSESVLARLHFVVRMPMGQSIGRGRRSCAGAGADARHSLLGRRVRRCAGDLADAAVRHDAGRAFDPGGCSSGGLQGRLLGPARGAGPHRADGAGSDSVAGRMRSTRPDETWSCTSPTGPTTKPICG